MNEAVELAKSILGPRMVSQQLDAAIKKPLEKMAHAVLALDEKVRDLEEKLNESAKLSLKVAFDKSNLADEVLELKGQLVKAQHQNG